MKSSVLYLLGVGLPLIAMMALWQYLTAPSEGARKSSAPRRYQTSNTSPYSEPQTPTSQVSDSRLVPAQTTIADSLEDWLSRWEDALHRRPDFQRDSAAELLRQHRFDEAGQAFDRLLVRQPNDPLLMTGKAVALTALGRHDDALPLFENVARQSPDNVPAQFNYAVSLMRVSERASAVTVLRRVLQLDPNHVRAKFNLAVLLQAMNQSAESLQLWRQLTDAATLSGSTLIDAWFHRGEMELDNKHPAEAEQCFLRITQIEPHNAQAWCNVGISRIEQFRRSDALKALETALQIDPDYVPALNQVAYLQAANYRDTGDVASGQAVVDCCRRSLRLKPNQPNIAALEQAVRRFDPDDTSEASPSSDP